MRSMGDPGSWLCYLGSTSMNARPLPVRRRCAAATLSLEVECVRPMSNKNRPGEHVPQKLTAENVPRGGEPTRQRRRTRNSGRHQLRWFRVIGEKRRRQQQRGRPSSQPDDGAFGDQQQSVCVEHDPDHGALAWGRRSM